jgi:[ribosomal protein S5]-alanine N-acetyltransferase
LDREVTLTANRLFLRPFCLHDVDDVLEYTNDPEWARYQVNIPSVPFTREIVEELVTMFSNPSDSQGILQMFAIVFDGKVIGEICLNQHDEDLRSDRFEITYSLARKYWGNGFMTEAARTTTNWAFMTHQNLNRMYAWCDPRNIGSWHVLAKLGMKREGQLRYHLKWHNEFRDQLFYGLLRDEWKGK